MKATGQAARQPTWPQGVAVPVPHTRSTHSQPADFAADGQGRYSELPTHLHVSAVGTKIKAQIFHFCALFIFFSFLL